MVVNGLLLGFTRFYWVLLGFTGFLSSFKTEKNPCLARAFCDKCCGFVVKPRDEMMKKTTTKETLDSDE